MKQKELFNQLFPPMNKEEQQKFLNEVAKLADKEARIESIIDPIQGFTNKNNA